MTQIHRIAVCGNLIELFNCAQSDRSRKIYQQQLSAMLPRLKEKCPSARTDN